MADTKITALTALTAADPANDVLPIVDVSDTTMAASGTTKKISVNNILGASGTATLASATITGDLTVDTSTLKVDSANNRVGIGTASPAYLFDVLATGAITATSSFAMARITGASAVANDLTLVGPNTSQVRINFGDTDLASVGEVGYDHSTNRMRFVTNNQQQYTIDPNGVFTWYDGAGGTRMTLNSTGLGVGVSPSAGGGCLQLKSGITFPATQVASSDPNTLDDYEEGTFTATLKGTVSDPTTPVTTTARYTKIGRVVTVTIQFSSVTTTGASGRIQIDGLPFTNNSSLAGTGSVGFNGMATFTGSPFASLSASSSTIAMFASNSAGAYTAVTFNAGTTQDLWTSLTYTV